MCLLLHLKARLGLQSDSCAVQIPAQLSTFWSSNGLREFILEATDQSEMVRLSATRSIWGYRGPVTIHSDEAAASNRYKTSGLPLNRRRPMDEVDGVAAWQMSVWMTKHGKVRTSDYCLTTVKTDSAHFGPHTSFLQELRPKLTSEHHRQLKQCFK